MNGKNAISYAFKSFRLEIAERQLLNNGVPVPLTPKAFDVITVLVKNAGHLVEKEELMEAIWPDAFVEEASVTRIVHTLRKALGDDQNGNKFIETVAKKGYRFVAEVSIENSGDVTTKVENLPPDIVSMPKTVVDREPPPRRRSNRLTVILAGGVFLAAVIGSYFLSINGRSASETSRRSVAVIPFANTTRETGLDYLVDGITDNVINQLSRLSGLRVIGGNSVARYKGKEIDLKKAAAELGVQTLIIGDIKQVENQLIINVNLVDPKDGSQIWGKQFVKNSLDVIATQNEISQAVAKNLRLNLNDSDKRILAERPTENAEAYQLYLKGRHFAQQNTPQGLSQSIELYSQAIDKDPRFAIAYSEMGMRSAVLGIYYMPPKEMMPRARAYANKALEMDDSLSDPHIVLGLVALLYDWDRNRALEELANGTVVNLKSIETFSCTVHVLQVSGKASDVQDPLRRALEDDPLSIALSTELGCNSYFARRYDESVKEYRESLEIEPRNFMAIYGLARTLNYQKQYQSAIEELEKAKEFMPMLPPIAIAEKSYALAKMGKRDEAEAGLKILDEYPPQVFVDPFFKAIVYLSLDDKVQTLEWLQKAYQAKSALMPTLVNDAKWDSLRNELRLLNLIPGIGVAE